MDRLLPLQQPPLDVRVREALSLHKADVKEHKPRVENSASRKERHARKSRRKGKGKEQIVGEGQEAASLRMAKKTAMKVEGRTIYSYEAAPSSTSSATKTRRQRSPPPLAAAQARLSDGRDFLPVMGDREDKDDILPLLSLHGTGKRRALKREDSFPIFDASGWSTPELGWSPASSSASSISPCTALPTLPASADEGTQKAEGSPQTGIYESDFGMDGLGLWLERTTGDVAADELFLQLINMDT